MYLPSSIACELDDTNSIQFIITCEQSTQILYICLICNLGEAVVAFRVLGSDDTIPNSI